MRSTLGQAKTANLGNAIGICATDSRFVTMLNEAQQRLVMGPELWWTMTQKYRVKVSAGCITWPRHIANIEAMAVSGWPMPTRNEWFEFLETGYGLRNCLTARCDWQAFDRGNAVTFDDIAPTGKKLKLYSDINEALGLTATFFGYNDSNNVIRDSATGVEGEVIAIPVNNATPITSTNYFSAITGVILPVRKGNTRLYELNVAAATQRQIGIFEPDETTPSYRRTFIGGYCDSTAQTVTVMAKREFIPVVNDNDFLMIANLPALKLMMYAIDSENKRDWIGKERYRAEAILLLEREAAHYLGTGNIVPMRIEGDLYGAGNIPTVY